MVCTNDADDGEHRKAIENNAVAESFNQCAGDEASNELADESERRQQRSVQGADSVLVGHWIVRAELPDESYTVLSSASVLSPRRKGCRTWIREDAAKAGCVIAEENVTRQHTKAREEKHGRDQAPSRAGTVFRHCSGHVNE